MFEKTDLNKELNKIHKKQMKSTQTMFEHLKQKDKLKDVIQVCNKCGKVDIVQNHKCDFARMVSKEMDDDLFYDT